MTTTTPTLRRLQHHQHDDIYRHSHDVNQRQRRHSDANYSVRPVGIQRATIQRYAGWEFSGSNFVASTCKQLLTTPPRLLLAPTTTFRLLPTFSMGRSYRKRQGQEDRGLRPPGTMSSCRRLQQNKKKKYMYFDHSTCMYCDHSTRMYHDYSTCMYCGRRTCMTTVTVDACTKIVVHACTMITVHE